MSRSQTQSSEQDKPPVYTTADINTLLDSENLSLTDFADTVGVAPHTVTNWVNEDSSILISAGTRRRIYDQFGHPRYTQSDRDDDSIVAENVDTPITTDTPDTETTDADTAPDADTANTADQDSDTGADTDADTVTDTTTPDDTPDADVDPAAVTVTADDIQAILDAEDLTQGEFADQIGTSRPAVSNWVNGHNPPSDEKQTRIIEEFGYPDTY